MVHSRESGTHSSVELSTGRRSGVAEAKETKLRWANDRISSTRRNGKRQAAWCDVVRGLRIVFAMHGNSLELPLLRAEGETLVISTLDADARLIEPMPLIKDVIVPTGAKMLLCIAMISLLCVGGWCVEYGTRVFPMQRHPRPGQLNFQGYDKHI